MLGIIVMGSSRSDGDTATVVNKLAQSLGFAVLDLKKLEFSDYDYTSNNLNDDFLPTVRKLVDNYTHIIFATPVYWYTMSALMKRFIDRISDCLRVEKETGRKFRGMQMSLLTVSNGERNAGFSSPFKLTAKYLGMTFEANQHVAVNELTDTIEQQIMPMVALLKQHQVK